MAVVSSREQDCLEQNKMLYMYMVVVYFSGANHSHFSETMAGVEERWLSTGTAPTWQSLMNAAATVNMTHFTISIRPGQNNTAETWHTTGIIYKKLLMMINITLLDLLKIFRLKTVFQSLAHSLEPLGNNGFLFLIL